MVRILFIDIILFFLNVLPYLLRLYLLRLYLLRLYFFKKYIYIKKC